jgi:phosphatidylglycerophosphate synthase
MNPYYVIPWMLTTVGLVAGIVGIQTQSIALLLASLVCDIMDGATARALGIASNLGGIYDFAVDATLAGAMAWTVHPYMLGLPVAWQIVTKGRYSGRALMTGILCFQFLRW